MNPSTSSSSSLVGKIKSLLLRPLTPLTLTDSIDGQPLVTHPREWLPWNFPYDRLPTSDDNRLIVVSSWLLRPEVVLILVVLYLCSELPLLLLRSILGLDHIPPTSDPSACTSASTTTHYSAWWLQRFVALHNLILCVFSAVVALHSWPMVFRHYVQYGFFDSYCDPAGTLWNRYHHHHHPSNSGAGLGYWSIAFYISKYYEWIDTFILVLKKGRGGASFLQVYHHTGIVLAMYGAVTSQSAWLSWVVLLNSVIHTLMYAYFTVKTLFPTTPKTTITTTTTKTKATTTTTQTQTTRWWFPTNLLSKIQARHLTQAQIGQFWLGLVGTWGVLYMGDACDTLSSCASLVLLQVYGIGLLLLFYAFARRKYNATNTNDKTQYTSKSSKSS